MSCPYCLAYAPASASKGPSSGARQPRQLEQSRTLVKAYWEFEEGDHWLGFSPKVSFLLEAAYQNWLQNPSEVRSQIHGKDFLYNVDYTTLLEEGQRQSQRIRRVGVTADDNGGHDKAYCTVDPALWRDMQSKLQSFREEQEWLLRLLRSNQDGATVPDMKKDGFYGTLAEEVGRLWQRAGRQAAELEELRSQAQRSSELLERLRSAVLPGRLVCGSNVLGVAAAVETDMVQILQDQGHDRHWVVPKEEVRRARLGLLARPGSKVFYPHGGHLLEGVVSVGSATPLDAIKGQRADVDADLHVSVLRADGKSCRMPLAVLKPRGDGGSPFSVGDVVRACEHDSFAGVEDGPAAGTLGIVMQVCEDLAAEMNSISVRFPDATATVATGFRDVNYTEGQAMEQLQLDQARGARLDSQCGSMLHADDCRGGRRRRRRSRTTTTTTTTTTNVELEMSETEVMLFTSCRKPCIMTCGI
ncbi:unnamed protein product [Cladocopium goreaui]|uniref:WWE domain-containing protein n=1 Tax=Cladocopium goreaui TaxID=2562237 RepID=A0A9P1GGA8_9DINO|nr:unnamed protein product [Cladocopium goreaui]